MLLIGGLCIMNMHAYEGHHHDYPYGNEWTGYERHPHWHHWHYRHHGPYAPNYPYAEHPHWEAWRERHFGYEPAYSEPYGHHHMYRHYED